MEDDRGVFEGDMVNDGWWGRSGAVAVVQTDE